MKNYAIILASGNGSRFGGDLPKQFVKISGKDEEKKISRWQKIAEVAAKQSHRDIIPKIDKFNKMEEDIL